MNDLHAEHADRVAAAHAAHAAETAQIRDQADRDLQQAIVAFGQALTDASRAAANAYLNAGEALKTILDRACEQSAEAFAANEFEIAASARAMETAMRDRLAYFVAGPPAALPPAAVEPDPPRETETSAAPETVDFDAASEGRAPPACETAAAA